MMAAVIRLGGVAEAGQMQVAVMLGSAVVTVLNAVNNAWAPMVMQAPADERADMLARSSVMVAAVALVLVSGYVVLAPFVVPLVGGPAVADDLPVRASAIVAMAGAFHVAYLANIHLTFISGRTWPLALSTPLAAALAVSTGVLCGIAFPSEYSLIGYTLVWPVFYLFQAVASFGLARVGGLEPARLGRASAVLGVTCVVALQAVVLIPQPFWSFVVVGVAALVGAVLWLILRRAGNRVASA